MGGGLALRNASVRYYNGMANDKRKTRATRIRKDILYKEWDNKTAKRTLAAAAVTQRKRVVKYYMTYNV